MQTSSEHRDGPESSVATGFVAHDADGVRRVADLHLRNTDGSVPVRVRWPANPPGSPPPVVVYLPEAGPANGVDPADDRLAHALCARVGAVVLCVPWAARRDGARRPALEHAGSALEWASDHAGELGGDSRRVIVAGRGAGAAAAAVLAFRARDRGWPPLLRQLLVLTDPGDRRRPEAYEAAARAAAPSESGAGERPAAPAIIVRPSGPASNGGHRCAERLRALGIEVEELTGGESAGSVAPGAIGIGEPLLARLAESLREAAATSIEASR